MQTMESEGKSVTEAVESALKKMGLRRDQVEVQILQEGSSGFMGLGAKPARVRLTEKRWGPEPAAKPAEKPRAQNSGPSQHQAPAAPRPAPKPQASAPRQKPAAPAVEERPASDKLKAAEPQAACSAAQDLTQELLELMSLQEAAAKAAWEDSQERVKVSVTGPDAERLIGPEGRTLEALQFLMNLILNRRLNAAAAVQVDVAGYWEKREQEILARAQKGAEDVKRTGKPYRLEPMDSLTRRLIHRHFANHPDVVTASEGEGLWRKIVLRPRKG